MRKGSKTYPKDFSQMSKRFIAAYDKIPEKLRPNFLEDFAAATKCAITTAKSRSYGYADATEWEVLWAEGYNPFTRKSSLEEIVS